MKNYKTLPKDVADILSHNKINGLLFDFRDMEGSGGGYYPLWSMQNDGSANLLIEDIGSQIAHNVLDNCKNQDAPENCWNFYITESGDYVIENLKTGALLKKKPQQPDVYSRIYLNYPGRNLAIEYIDGYTNEDKNEYVDTWRLIDLTTGEVFCEDVLPHEVIGEAAAIQAQLFKNESHDEYVKPIPPITPLRALDTNKTGEKQ